MLEVVAQSHEIYLSTSLPTGLGFHHKSVFSLPHAFIMVSIRQATLEDLLSMQDANLHCLPENYQVTTRCETTTPPHRPPRAQDHNPQAMMPTPRRQLCVCICLTHTRWFLDLVVHARRRAQTTRALVQYPW